MSRYSRRYRSRVTSMAGAGLRLPCRGADLQRVSSTSSHAGRLGSLVGVPRDPYAFLDAFPGSPALAPAKLQTPQPTCMHTVARAPHSLHAHRTRNTMFFHSLAMRTPYSRLVRVALLHFALTGAQPAELTTACAYSSCHLRVARTPGRFMGADFSPHPSR